MDNTVIIRKRKYDEFIKKDDSNIIINEYDEWFLNDNTEHKIISSDKNIKT